MIEWDTRADTVEGKHDKRGTMTAEKLSGVKVLEVAEYAVAPSAGAVLADWGADVIKVEHAI
jgi:crotonobetainyl-CoA:carnitine CoA-transferase CaiB-like acyl-CoA transferase